MYSRQVANVAELEARKDISPTHLWFGVGVAITKTYAFVN